ncbi:hypothetical protein BXP70_14245 [Hymenobacter crusticola]|uniref:Uncharacterized protein n=1 Tax=Hymenobacter crusticola TaxID=1770526 RepID=A0A243WD42_9BACT|nr:hypothetical protein BXP70_14245 [Hymenobacter crusticola]
MTRLTSKSDKKFFTRLLRGKKVFLPLQPTSEGRDNRKQVGKNFQDLFWIKENDSYLCIPNQNKGNKTKVIPSKSSNKILHNVHLDEMDRRSLNVWKRQMVKHLFASAISDIA